MTDLSALLDDARAGLSPTAEETSRVREKLLAVVAAPALIAAAPVPAVSLVKLGALGAGLVAAVIASVVALGGAPPDPPPEKLPTPAVVPAPAPAPEALPPLEVVLPPVRPERAREAGESKGGKPPRKQAAPLPPPPPDDSLARELRHLSTARAALRSGDKAAARAALEEYDLEFDDNGQLAAEAAKLAKEASDAP